jgi:hypothetical protein
MLEAEAGQAQHLCGKSTSGRAGEARKIFVGLVAQLVSKRPAEVAGSIQAEWFWCCMQIYLYAIRTGGQLLARSLLAW